MVPYFVGVHHEGLWLREPRQRRSQACGFASANARKHIANRVNIGKLVQSRSIAAGRFITRRPKVSESDGSEAWRPVRVPRISERGGHFMR